MAQLRREIADMAPVDERHEASIREFVAALGRLRDPFDEHADPTHVTASALVLGHRGTVLHRHKRLGLWLQPGGHIGDGELPWEAAQREVREETGLTAFWDGIPPLVHVDAHPGGRGHRHLDLRYPFFAPDDDPAPGEGESPDVRWFALDEAISVADIGLVGALRILAAELAGEIPVPARNAVAPQRVDPASG